jgi:hypothetical protein
MPKLKFENVECPDCTTPVDVVDRFALESTDDPIEHAIVLSVLRHLFPEGSLWATNS